MTMTIKQIIDDFNRQLKNKEIKGSDNMAKALSIIAVKAETIGGDDGKELAGLCDRLKVSFKKLHSATDDELSEFAADWAKLMHFAEKEKYSYLFGSAEQETEQWQKEMADEDRKYALEDVQKAYNNYVQLRNDYIREYGEYPDVETID